MFYHSKKILNDGFSLLETMVVLVIVSIVFLVAIPGIGSIVGVRFRIMLTGIVSDLDTLRQDAVRKRIPTAIVRESSGYRLIPSGVRRELPHGATLIFSSASVSPDVNEQNIIRFLSDGSSSGGAVHLLQSDKRSTINIRQLDSQIEIKSQ